MSNETKSERFKRLAKQRGERALKDIQLVGNLSNKNNYEYSESDIRKIFTAIEDEIKAAKSRFTSSKKREIRF